MDMADDLTIVRNILHTNMLLCLIIVQILFLFGIGQTKHKVILQNIPSNSIKLNYYFVFFFFSLVVE